jgi:hypothetical protein
MISVLLATLITKLPVPVMYAIFVLDLRILKSVTPSQLRVLRQLSWRVDQA